jgi:hypothetical protein
MVPPELEAAFPGLAGTGSEVTSQATPIYNCIAWAASEDFRWWEPDPFNIYYWPDHAPRDPNITSLLSAFAGLGYQPCHSDELEAGFEKVAIYQGANGFPSHMARQLLDGSWTSKLGQSVDISHDDVRDLEGATYGTLLLVLRRPI